MESPSADLRRRCRTLERPAARLGKKPSVGHESLKLETVARDGSATRKPGTLKRELSPSTNSSATTSSSEGAGLGRRKRAVLTRVGHRRQAQHLMRSLEEDEYGLEFLEQEAVTPRVGKLYKARVAELVAQSQDPRILDAAPAVLDAALVKFFTVLFFRGEQASTGLQVSSAVLHHRPGYGKGGSLKLPRCWRALRGWRRLCPPRSRQPEPLMVWAGIMHEMVSMNMARVALLIALSLSTYLRPSSLLMLTSADLYPPVLGISLYWSLLVHRQGSRPSKTGEYDLSVVLDSYWLLFLTPVLELLQKESPGVPVWGFGYPTVLSTLRQACINLGLKPVTPYQARHSGASTDRASNARTLLDIQKRGGWKTMKSVCRYEKGARLAQRASKLTPLQVSHFGECLRHLEDALVWGKPIAKPGGIKAGR